LWIIFGIVGGCAATAILTLDFLVTLTGIEFILCAVIAAGSFFALLLRKRAGVSILIYSVAAAISAGIGILVSAAEEMQFLVALGCALIPAATWLILSGSWQNGAPEKKKEETAENAVNTPSPVVIASSPSMQDTARGKHKAAVQAVPDKAAMGATMAISIAEAPANPNTAVTELSPKDRKKLEKLKQKEERERQKQLRKKGASDTGQPMIEIDTFPSGPCAACGAVSEDGARFCKMCGERREPVKVLVAADADGNPANQIAAETKNAKTKKIYLEMDNRGTMHKNVGQATSYWVMRRPAMQKKPPYLLYVFCDKETARKALLDISYIHTAADTGMLICDHLMEYGYYEVANDDETVCYEALVCGHDLIPERYSEAREAFEKHGGRMKNEQAPDPNHVELQGTIEMNAIVLKEEFVDNGRYKYRVHYAPNRATAIEFLRQNRVEQEYLYIMVETPEGSYGRDIDGMYEV
jgi:hypothetical protein